MAWPLAVALASALCSLVGYLAYLVFCYAVYALRGDGEALGRAGKIGRFRRK